LDERMEIESRLLFLFLNSFGFVRGFGLCRLDIHPEQKEKAKKLWVFSSKGILHGIIMIHATVT